MKALAELIAAENIKSVAITRLATGVGGLPCVEVKPMIETYLKGTKATIFVYDEFHQGVKAKES